MLFPREIWFANQTGPPWSNPDSGSSGSRCEGRPKDNGSSAVANGSEQRGAAGVYYDGGGCRAGVPRAGGARCC